MVVLVGFSTGLLGSVVFFAVSGPEWQARAFYWGACSGLAQGTGWGILSYAMSIGRVSIVAPIAAAGASTCLFLTGVATGDAASALSIVGAVGVLASIVLLTRESGDGSLATVGDVSSTSQRKAPLLALIVAVCFALQAICLNQVSDNEPSVVMLGARLAVVLLIGASLLMRPVKWDASSPKRWMPAVIGGGFLLLGDVVYLAALSNGPLSVAGVLAGANPAVTVVLAAFILREHLRRMQIGGILLALAGSALLAVG